MAKQTEVTIVGNLTADPELRYTQSGIAVANFTVASTPREFDKQTNEWKDGETLFLRASVWRDYAEHVAASLTKGQSVVVVGKLVQRSYEKDGEKRTAYEIEAEEVGTLLRYGTTVFTKSAAKNGAQAPVAAPQAQQQVTQQAPAQQVPVQQAPVQQAPTAVPAVPAIQF